MPIMSEYDGFGVGVDGGIGWLTIDRPDKRNAVTSAMWQALPDLLGVLAKDPHVKVLLVSGAGPGFSALDPAQLTPTALRSGSGTPRCRV
jgi:enoyl-CoA hydratase/carnithine racemase